MATLTPRARRLARELDEAIAAGNVRRVVSLVDEYGLPRDQRLAVCRELDRPANGAVVGLRFDIFDQARVRVLADVWRA